MYTYEYLMDDEEIVAKGELDKSMLISTWFFGILLCVLIFPLIFAIIETIRFKKQGIIVTNKRVIGSARFGFARSEIAIPLNHVQSVSVDQPLFGRILKYGAVTVGTGSGNGRIVFPQIKNPQEFRLALMQQADCYK